MSKTLTGAGIDSINGELLDTAFVKFNEGNKDGVASHVVLLGVLYERLKIAFKGGDADHINEILVKIAAVAIYPTLVEDVSQKMSMRKNQPILSGSEDRIEIAKRKLNALRLERNVKQMPPVRGACAPSEYGPADTTEAMDEALDGIAEDRQRALDGALDAAAPQLTDFAAGGRHKSDHQIASEEFRGRGWGLDGKSGDWSLEGNDSREEQKDD